MSERSGESRGSAVIAAILLAAVGVGDQNRATMRKSPDVASALVLAAALTLTASSGWSAPPASSAIGSPSLSIVDASRAPAGQRAPHALHGATRGDLASALTFPIARAART